MSAGDLLPLERRLNHAQRALRDRVRGWVESRVLPVIDEAWERAEQPHALLREMAGLGIAGGMYRGHGNAGLDALSWGLVRAELARGDGSVASFYGVHSGLAMGAINELGSEGQRERWIPAMARFELTGAFALTEPGHGSDAAGLECRAVRDGDVYRLTGAKRWIGNATSAGVLVVWARDQDGLLGGFVMERPQHVVGVSISAITGKVAKRALDNAHIALDGAVVPATNRLPGARSFGDIACVLGPTRYTIAWEAAGIATVCFELAREHALARHQFGKPIGSFQLVQARLVDMAIATAAAQQACLELAARMDAGSATPGEISMAKLACTRWAHDVAHAARAVLGGEGILLERRIARLMLDAEVALTYEGTEEMNALIVGRAITGLAAFGA